MPGGVYNIRGLPPAGSGFAESLVLGRAVTSDLNLDFAMVPASAVGLRGRLVDGNGVGIPGQDLRLVAGGNSTTVITDAEGHYTLTATPGEDVLFSNSANWSGIANAPGYCWIESSPFSLSGDTVMDLALPAKRVRLHVRDLAGTPVANVRLGSDQPYNGELPLRTF